MSFHSGSQPDKLVEYEKVPRKNESRCFGLMSRACSLALYKAVTLGSNQN